MMDAMTRQQAAIRDAQRQVLGNKAVPPLNPSGKFSAPAVPPQSQLIFKGGGVYFQSPVRANLVSAVAGVASQMMVEPLSDIISDNIVFLLMEKVLGRELPSTAEIRQRQELERQNPQQVGITKDAVADALPQTSLEASVMPLNPIDDVDVSIDDSTPLGLIVEVVEEMHSPSPEDDERNREYLIRRAVLGDNPSQEKLRAVVEYGLQQHGLSFPRLYQYNV